MLPPRVSGGNYTSRMHPIAGGDAQLLRLGNHEPLCTVTAKSTGQKKRISHVHSVGDTLIPCLFTVVRPGSVDSLNGGSTDHG